MRKIKILHIEDDKDYSKLLSDALEDYEIENVTTGKDALVKLNNPNDFNIIICDCRLPDTCGIILVKKIKEITKIPIIANSSNMTNNIKMWKAGANCYIPKGGSLHIKDFKILIEIQIRCLMKIL